MAILKSSSSGGGVPSASTVRAITTATKATTNTGAAKTADIIAAGAAKLASMATYYTGNPNLITGQKAIVTPVKTVTTSSGGTTGVGLTGGGPTGGGTIENQPPPPKPKPPTAGELGVVKTPGRDVTKISDLVQQTPADTIKRLAFEQLSAIELSQILTSSTVDGVNQKYSVISNLSDIRKRYDASTNLSIMNKNTPMTGVYNIDIDSKIPGFTYLIQNNLFSSNHYVDVDNSLNSVEKGYIYIDTNGDLIIEVDNMKSDEILQVQIVTDGTIYEVTN